MRDRINDIPRRSGDKGPEGAIEGPGVDGGEGITLAPEDDGNRIEGPENNQDPEADVDTVVPEGRESSLSDAEREKQITMSTMTFLRMMKSIYPNLEVGNFADKPTDKLNKLIGSKEDLEKALNLLFNEEWLANYLQMELTHQDSEGKRFNPEANNRFIQVMEDLISNKGLKDELRETIKEYYKKGVKKDKTPISEEVNDGDPDGPDGPDGGGKIPTGGIWDDLLADPAPPPDMIKQGGGTGEVPSGNQADSTFNAYEADLRGLQRPDERQKAA